jgi:GntR family transcriptional repressor for pyruvate dehydrogenase complex
VNFNKEDFASLIEARYYLEINSARLAAERRTEDDISQMQNALGEFDSKINRGLEAIEEDLLFHIKVAAATKNSVIESMILIIIPDLINLKTLMGLDINKEINYSIDQHHSVLNAIKLQDVEEAGKAMAEHLQVIMDNRRNILL